MASRDRDEGFHQLSNLFTRLPADEQEKLLKALIAAAPPSLVVAVTSNNKPSSSPNSPGPSAIPRLPISSKKTELSNLLTQLEIETARAAHAYILGPSAGERDEILAELGSSIADWLPDIWSMGVVHRVHFGDVHEALMTCMRILDSLASGGINHGACMCTFESMFFLIKLETPSGLCAHRFEVDGGSTLMNVLAWIWRDLFVTMIAAGNPARDMVNKMLEEIEESFGWDILDRIILAGNLKSEDEDVWEDADDEDEADEEVNEDEEIHDAPNHLAHWTPTMHTSLSTLNSLISTVLQQRFTSLPSSDLYEVITRLSPTPLITRRALLDLLKPLALVSPDALYAALSIAADDDDHNLIETLLSPDHAHLLTSLHTPALLAVFNALSKCPPHTPQALTLASSQVRQIISSIHTSLLSFLPGLDTPLSQADLASLLQQRSGTAARRGRVEAWGESIARDPHHNDDDGNGGGGGHIHGGPMGGMAAAMAQFFGGMVMAGIGGGGAPIPAPAPQAAAAAANQPVQNQPVPALNPAPAPPNPPPGGGLGAPPPGMGPGGPPGTNVNMGGMLMLGPQGFIPIPIPGQPAQNANANAPAPPFPLNPAPAPVAGPGPAPAPGGGMHFTFPPLPLPEEEYDDGGRDGNDGSKPKNMYPSGMPRRPATLFARLNAWLEQLHSLPASAANSTLECVYEAMVVTMPWLIARDAVDEVMGRVVEYGAQMLADAVRTMALFVRARRRAKVKKSKGEMEKKKVRKTRQAPMEGGEEDEVRVIVPTMAMVEPSDFGGLDEVD